MSTKQATGATVGKTYAADERFKDYTPLPSSMINTPSPQAAADSGNMTHMTTVPSAAAGNQGSMSNWHPNQQTISQEARSRESVAKRSNDMAQSTPTGARISEVFPHSIVGTGFLPQSQPQWKRLGIEDKDLQELITGEMEFEFAQFNSEAGADGHSTLADMAWQNIWSMVVNGEFCNIPLMLDGEDRGQRRFAFALQSVTPSRLRTPGFESFGMQKPKIREGIAFGKYAPKDYYIADPQDGRISSATPITSYKKFPAFIGNTHRRGFFHGFYKKQPEQFRGFPFMAPALKTFKDSNEYMDYELIGAIIAASFAVYIESQNPNMFIGPTGQPVIKQPGSLPDAPPPNQVVTPGQITHGQHGYGKAQILSGNRPGNSFEPFTKYLERQKGTSVGLPYELSALDFSETNYSSARAALNEAWRMFGVFQQWLIAHWYQIIYSYVIEEAWLAGRISIPSSAPDFYAARAEYTWCHWITPKAGSIDPVKDAVAIKHLLANDATTLADIYAEKGQDWEGKLAQREREVGITSVIAEKAESRTGANNAA